MKLRKLRASEFKRLLSLCQDVDDVTKWAEVFRDNLDESRYLSEWLTGLMLDAGLPYAQSVTRDLSRRKAFSPPTAWEQALRRYAFQEAGAKIVTVQRTFINWFQADLTARLLESETHGVEFLTKRLMSDFRENCAWMVRRIAQTETMIGLAEAGQAAADTLDIEYTKQWICSGLSNTRDSHLAMDGVIVGQNDYFQVNGSFMLYPHDQSTNPDASEIINCACDVLRLPK